MLGQGTIDNPYLVSTPQELNDIRSNLDAHYKLANDIDMSGWGNFTPLGNISARFTGTLDGQGYKIINLSIVNNVDYNAFIGATNGGAINNLGLENVYAESDKSHLAGLVGLNYMATITNCYATGQIKNTNSSAYYTGGLIGRNYGEITNCYAECIVTGGRQVGGFVAHLANSTSKLTYNYSNSTVSGASDVGVFYGFANNNSGSRPYLQTNYYNSDLGTNESRLGVIPATSNEMQQQDTYVTWDFVDTWELNNDYPKLRVFNKDTPSEPPQSKQQAITLQSYVQPIATATNTTTKQATPPKSANIATYSTISPLSTHTTQTKCKIKHLNSKVSNITTTTSTQEYVKLPNRVDTQSHMQPIHTTTTISFTHAPRSATRGLFAFVSPIHTNTTIRLPSVPTMAYTSVQDNPSNVYHVVNPSYVEVI